MSARSALIGSLTTCAFLPQSVSAHSFARHANGTLGAVLFIAEIGLALAFAVVVAWTLYDRFREDNSGKEWNEERTGDE